MSKLLGLLKLTRQHLNPKDRLYYKTYIEPFITDALIVYGSTKSNNLHTILLLQRRILRVIFGEPLSLILVDCLNVQVFKAFVTSIPQP